MVSDHLAVYERVCQERNPTTWSRNLGRAGA
jgi:hypothetical protein